MPDASKWGPELGLPVWRLNRILTIIQARIQTLSEDGRELPIVWSAMHMYSTSQLAKLLAIKRGINPELAGLVCAFHDIYTIHTGLTKDHAKKAEKYIREIVDEYNEKRRFELSEITNDEVDQIINAIIGHSEKRVTTDDPLAELLKDIDSLDSYLHGLALRLGSGRIPRVNKVLEEFGLEYKL